MVKTLLQTIYTEENKRSTLSELRKEIKEKNAFGLVFADVEEHLAFFLSLLSHEDAKTRKNAALLLGDLGIEEALDSLWDAYQKETQLFVKGAYLSAIHQLDYDALLPKLHELCTQLSSTTLTTENKKHIEEQLRVLNDMIIATEGINEHTFTGYLHEHDCILLTNRDYKEITQEQITDGEILPFASGVRVKTSNLHTILEIRTYQELLFVIPNLSVCPAQPEQAAKKIVSSALLTLLKNDHRGTLPFYFRIEVKSKQPLDKRALFAKKLASSLENLTNRALINSPKEYEFELRMIENKEGNYNVLLKYMTIPDTRFDYREEHVSASIKPATAALLVALAKEYMVADAQVLDPFCGVATMLIERQKVVKANTSYAIDTAKEAIEKAKINMQNAGQIIHFVNKNCLDFTHEYKFHEIFTNMPWAIGHTTQEDIDELYQKFFKKTKTLLAPNPTIILYTHDEDLVRRYALQNGYHIEKSYPIHKKEGTALVIVR